MKPVMKVQWQQLGGTCSGAMKVKLNKATFNPVHIRAMIRALDEADGADYRAALIEFYQYRAMLIEKYSR